MAKYKLKALHKNRLLKLAKFLNGQVPTALFRMRAYMYPDSKGHIHKKASLECGTPACALGWATMLFKPLYYSERWEQVRYRGMRVQGFDFDLVFHRVNKDFFGLDALDGSLLFGGRVERTPKREAALIEQMVARRS